MPGTVVTPQPNPGAAVADTTQPGGWAQSVLNQLGAPSDPSTAAGRANINFLEAWAAAEGTSAQFNPLATTLPQTGSIDFNSAGVQSYASPADGIAATARTLLAGYPHVVASLRGGDPSAITSSAGGRADLNRWSTGKSTATLSQYVLNIQHLFTSMVPAKWTKWSTSAGSVIPGVPIPNPLSAVSGIADAVTKVVGAILDQNTWRRIGLALLGLVMMLSGGYILAKGVGAAPGVVPIPV